MAIDYDYLVVGSGFGAAAGGKGLQVICTPEFDSPMVDELDA